MLVARMSASGNTSQFAQSPELVRDLAQRMRGIERSFAGRADERTISSGIAELDKLLPHNGFRPGTLVEWLSDSAGSPAAVLATLALKSVLGRDGILTVIEADHTFYPPAAELLGVDLKRTVIVRPESQADMLWATEQALRCQGVTAVLCWIEIAGQHVFRRLQLASETGKGLGFVMRPASARRQAAWADIRLLIRPRAERTIHGRSVSVELLKQRGGFAAGMVDLEISHETGDVRLAAKLAATTSQDRAGRI